MNPDRKSYNLSADVIRVLAICGVVLIHTANAVTGRPDFFGGVSWWFAVLLDAISRSAIPLFILISGYFLLNKNESWTNSLKRALHRVLIPLLFWFGIDMLWNSGSPTLYYINPALVQRLFTVNVLDLYFLVILVGLYIAAPLLRAFLQSVSVSMQKNFMLFTLIGGVVMFFIQYLFSLCSPANSFTYWVPYTGLFVAGYVLGKSAVKRTKLITATYLVSLFLTIGSIYVYNLLAIHGNTLLNSHGCLSYYSISYLSINVVIMSLCAFVLLMHANFSKIHPMLKSVIYSIARATLGIYVMHTFFLDVLDGRLHLFDHITPAWFYIIVKWAIIFSLSYISAVFIAKIPLIKRTLGITK